MYGNSVGKLTDARKAYTSIVTDNVLSYRKSWKCRLDLDAMIGHSFSTDASSTASQTGQGFPSDDFNVNSVAAEYIDVTSGRTSWSMQSFIFRTTLKYNGRYLLTVSARADGTSKFASKNRYGFFPSVSGGWIISQEPFWKDSRTEMKIRASVGSTGNQGCIGAYAWMPLANGGYNYLNESGIAFMTKRNKKLKWEKATQYNLGVDASFFEGRFTTTVELFRKDTRDLLYNKPISATSGFTNEICNIGAMRNDGIELTLGSNISSGEFRWQGGFNISFIRNRLTALIADEVLTTGSYHALKVGEEVGSFYMIKMLGIYQSDDDVPAEQYAQGVRAGDV
jgi:outer membrane receptor protein involved in Fe transport